MSTIQTMFLMCWAALDLGLVIFNPSLRFACAVQGMPKEAVKKQWAQQHGAEGCNLAAGMLLELFVTLVVEPGYLLWALCAHMGSPQIALGVGGILVANLLTTLNFQVRDRKKATYPILTTVRWLGIWFFTIPTLYPWYLLLAVIGIVH